MSAVFTAPAGRRFADLTSPQAAALSPDAVLMLPIGATEQHGPHLPLGTDTRIAEAASQAVVARSGEELDLWILPTLAVSLSDEHIGTPGTLTLSVTTLMAVLDDLGRSLATLPPRRLVLVNAHGGNTSLLGVACRQLRIRYGLLTFLLHPSLPVDHGGQSDGPEGSLGIHAGHEETSLLLHLTPELVDMAKARADVPTWLEQLDHVGIAGPVSFGWTAADLSATGTIGDPTAADAAHGAVLFDAMTVAMADALREVRAFTLPRAGSS
jgi:creatinine amidohydrolase